MRRITASCGSVEPPQPGRQDPVHDGSTIEHESLIAPQSGSRNRPTTHPAVFKTIPSGILQRVEPEAGQVLPATRQRRRVEFHPNWQWVCSAEASPEAVAAAFTQSAHDVPDRVWERMIRHRVPEAWAIMQEHHISWERLNEGRCPPGVRNRWFRLINEATGDYELLRLSPVADVIDSIESHFGVAIDDIAFG